MLDTILGNKTAAKIMLYLLHYGEGYAKDMSRDLDIALSQVQKQLNKYDQEGILISKDLGRVRMFSFNDKLATVKEFKKLIKFFYDSISIEEKQELFKKRKRPRRKGKLVTDRD